MAGLFSSLAITTPVAASIFMGVQPPAAPEIPSQNITAPEQGVTANSSTQSLDITNITQNVLEGDDTHNGDTPSISSLVTGVDVSSHQHALDAKINIKEIVNGGQKFAFIKSTEGTEYINPHFRSDVMNFMSQDIPIGFYHYARPSSSPDDAKNQAQHFISVTGIDKGVKAFPPVLDLEETGGLSPQELINWTEEFVNEVRKLTGRDTMMYTSPSFWKDFLNNTTKFSELPLWLANYTNQSAPTSIPGGWDKWTFWQYTDAGRIPGSPKGIDMNLFNGSMEELESLYTSINSK